MNFFYKPYSMNFFYKLEYGIQLIYNSTHRALNRSSSIVVE